MAGVEADVNILVEDDAYHLRLKGGEVLKVNIKGLEKVFMPQVVLMVLGTLERNDEVRLPLQPRDVR